MSGARVAAGEQPVSPRTEVKAGERESALPFHISLAILCFSYWCVDIVTPALPAMQVALALSATGAGLVFSFFFAGRLIANVPAAWLVDRVGPRWTAVIGSAAFLAGSLLVIMARTETALLPARVVQGAGIALLITAGLLSLLRARPGSGAAMTAFNVAIGIGVSGGLLTGGYLTTELGWRSVFWLSAVVGAALLVGTLFARPRVAGERETRVQASADARQVTTSRAAPVAAVAANLLVFVNYSIWIVSLPLLAVRQFGLNAGQIGMLLFFVNGVHLMGAVPIGRVIAKTGAVWALAIGFGIGAIGMLLVPLAPSLPWLLVPMALYAIGQVASSSSAGDLVLRLGGGGGKAVGAVRLSSDVGLVIGPAAVGALADAAGVDAPFVALGVTALLTTMVVAGFGRWRVRQGVRRA